jgi:hypothetical protein
MTAITVLEPKSEKSFGEELHVLLCGFLVAD